MYGMLVCAGHAALALGGITWSLGVGHVGQAHVVPERTWSADAPHVRPFKQSVLECGPCLGSHVAVRHVAVPPSLRRPSHVTSTSGMDLLLQPHDGSAARRTAHRRYVVAQGDVTTLMPHGETGEICIGGIQAS